MHAGSQDILRRHLPGITVLDNDQVEIDCTRFFGTTLWSDFEGRSESAINGVRRRCGEFFFVKKRSVDAEGRQVLTKFRPEDAADAFDVSWAALQQSVKDANGKPTVIITHHAPSRQGLNPQFAGNGLDGAYASDLDRAITALVRVPVWVHGHTHIKRTYSIGGTSVLANCRGFAGKSPAANAFSSNAFFEI